MIKYIITNDLNKLYDTKEEAESVYKTELESLSGFERGAFKFMYHVAQYII